METTTPAHEILKQLGGNRFIAMTGSKNFCSDNNGNTLSMRLTSPKAKYLRITLNSSDTYTMEFLKETGPKYQKKIIEVARFEGVYNDMLQTIFTKVTGLHTSL